MPPAIKPIIKAPETLITSALAVIPTNPASNPFNAIERSGFLSTTQEMMIAPIAPAQAPNVVVVKTSPKALGSAERTDPPLNPYQPNMSKNTPIAAIGKLCAGIGLIPFSVYFPFLGPRTITHARAPNPPKAWTTVEPAKSLNPASAKTPPPQCQEPATG